MAGATRTIVIDAPVETVFAIVSDFESYPQFLPEVKSIRVSEKSAQGALVHYQVELMKTIRYTLRLKLEAPHKVSWTWVEGEFMKDNHGGWLLEEAGPGKTKATYTVEIALGPLVPKSIVNALVDTQLPKMLEAFKKRAEAAK